MFYSYKCNIVMIHRVKLLQSKAFGYISIQLINIIDEIQSVRYL